VTKASSDFGGEVTSAKGEFTFGDFLNLFLFSTRNDLGVAIRALKARGFFQSLAEPNLIAYNGQEASFLAGGEIPVPVVQSSAGIAATTVIYKEFGIRLTFRPTIIGDLIRLRVRPEVSSLDFGNGVTLEGFRIPALATRRAETEVELRDGQSFAIAGLIDDTAQDDRSKVPILGDIPILGSFFKSRASRQERTELLVMITPRLVRPIEPGQEPPLPINPELFLPKEERRPPAPKPPKSGGQEPEPGTR
jgi:pilus assembly protein CpaC